MTPVAWMAGTSVLAWAAATVAVPGAHPELLYGMLGPLASAVVTWIVTAHVHRVDPARVTGVLVAGFFARMVFVAAYMAVMLRGLALRPVPFAVTFASYLIGLYVMEALFLKRLFVAGAASSSGA